MSKLHPVKEETFDLDTMINTDPKGFERKVDTFTEAEGCLYMARQAPGHPKFHYLESWLIPKLDLRVSHFHFFEGIRPTQELYVDVAIIDDSNPRRWHTRDLYIDFVTYHGSRTHALDLDELGESLEAGLISPAEAARALKASQRFVDSIYAHGSLQMWLELEGFHLTWKSGL